MLCVTSAFSALSLLDLRQVLSGRPGSDAEVQPLQYKPGSIFGVQNSTLLLSLDLVQVGKRSLHDLEYITMSSI